MKFPSQGNSKQLSHGHSQNNLKEMTETIPPKPLVLRFLYKSFKYATLISFLFLVVVSGILILGDAGHQMGESRAIFNLYKNDEQCKKSVEQIDMLLNIDNSKFISKRVINLFLEQNDQNQKDLQGRFEDLTHFTEYYLSQRFANNKIVRLPLNLYEQKSDEIVPQTTSQAALQMLRQEAKNIFIQFELHEDPSVKEISWNRVKKLTDSGKLKQLLDLFMGNSINFIWRWIKDEPKVILLTVNGQELGGFSQEQKESLNRWIKQSDEDSQIIILSIFQINSIQDVEKEVHLKSYRLPVVTSMCKFDAVTFCKYFDQKHKIKQDQCQIMRNRFNSMNQVQAFLEQTKDQEPVMQTSGGEGQSVLGQVCSKGHIKYHFYGDQENAYKVTNKNKKFKKGSRLDKQIHSLIVKWSHLKRTIGFNKLNDIYLTLTAGRQTENNITLRQANQLGLIFDFDLHQLRWRSDQDRIKYQIRTSNLCMGGQAVDQQIMKQEQEQRKKQEQQHKRANQVVYDENEENNEQNNDDAEEQVQEQQYEQNFIKWDNEKDKDTSLDNEEQVELVDDQELDQQSGELNQHTDQKPTKKDGESAQKQTEIEHLQAANQQGNQDLQAV